MMFWMMMLLKWVCGYKIEWSYKNKNNKKNCPCDSTSIGICVCVWYHQPTTTSNSTWHVQYKLICAQKLLYMTMKCIKLWHITTHIGVRFRCFKRHFMLCWGKIIKMKNIIEKKLIFKTMSRHFLTRTRHFIHWQNTFSSSSIAIIRHI